ncbi:T6SS phospholipase effector Tle1-like catalytic domain-containing protein, partial [Pseudomonas sp.]|uniref:T6SS phospholipase effector Tle1-like catalytic domain-containing protein n=1 Tax=Pseudomonas sp. TaxID=306 RepID=UPI0040538246
MTLILRGIFLGFVGLVSAACSTTYTTQIHPSVSVPESTKQIVLFLDGTQNDRDSRTNISTLSEIIKNQNKDNLYMFYSEGVGTDNRLVGAGTGWGIGKDVAEAYSFLSKYYSSDSKVYIFGFSRGSYASRILAGMVYALGVYDLSKFPENRRLKIAEELYDEYKGKNKTVGDIRQAGNAIVSKWVAENNLATVNVDHGVSIEVMGLWDTVEALGAVPTLEAIMRKIFRTEDPQNIVNPNDRYIDQICNVKKIYHALALDDNR